jgi:small subunit ribosomal protein S17
MTTTGRKPRRTMIGTVVSDKMQKTVVVAVEKLTTHRLYGKTMRRTKRYKAHDEDNAAKAGDRVEIEETRPLSKDKRWRVVTIIKKQATGAIVHEAGARAREVSAAADRAERDVEAAPDEDEAGDESQDGGEL